jgi:hypothetical protein
MSIQSSAWSLSLYSRLTSKGFFGSRLMEMCDAVGEGSAPSVIGKTFQTLDTGLIFGHSVGVGHSIIGIVATTVQTSMYGKMTSYGWRGSRMMEVCEAVAEALVEQMLTADLLSSNSPVFSGAGQIIIGSIPVVSSEWTSNVQAKGTSRGFIGSQWPMMADAIGIGSVAGFATATGTLALSGAYEGGYPPGPIPGSGTGNGTIL